MLQRSVSITLRSFAHIEALWLISNSSAAKVSGNCIEFQGKKTAVGTFPIGIAPDELREELSMPKEKNDMASIHKKFDGIRLIVGVDRMDYIKGVPQKL